MAWSEQLFRYCERGADAAFWAEPLNALSNIAFLVAALAAGRELAGRPTGGRRHFEALLVVLVAVIGVGSFLFHTLATRWAMYADVIPIGLFMLAYWAYTLRVYLRLPWLLVAIGVAGFIWALQVAGQIACRPGLFAGSSATGPCLNGTIGYTPALLAMVGIGALLMWERHPAWRYVAGAGAVFLVSMTARTVDLELCGFTQVLGSANGTHVFWHMLNATTLYLLLVAAIRHGDRAFRAGAGVARRPGPSHNSARADVVEPVDTQDLKS